MKPFFAVILAVCLAACASAPVQKLEKNFSLPVVSNTQQVKVAVFRACARLGWKCVSVTDSSAEANFAKNGRQVWADISYSPRSYSISYKHSTGLAYTAGEEDSISPRYWRWIKRLSAQIDRELQKINQSGVNAPSQGV